MFEVLKAQKCSLPGGGLLLVTYYCSLHFREPRLMYCVVQTILVYDFLISLSVINFSFCLSMLCWF